MFEKASSSSVYQLKKYYPKIHKNFIEKQRIAFSEYLESNLKRGIAEEYYRKEINIELCTWFYFLMVFGIHESGNESDNIHVLGREVLELSYKSYSNPKRVKRIRISIKK